MPAYYISAVPKLPSRDIAKTADWYGALPGIKIIANYGDYLLLGTETIELHFFLFKDLEPSENYGQVYIKTNDIDKLYAKLLELNIPIHPNGHLQNKPWRQREFALLDPDNNLLTFGQSI